MNQPSSWFNFSSVTQKLQEVGERGFVWLRNVSPSGTDFVRFVLQYIFLILLNVALAYHLPVLDGLNQHFQATVHLPQTSDIDYLSNVDNFFPLECCESNLGHLGQEASMLTIVLCCPLEKHL